jgi:hypothetical protein
MLRGVEGNSEFEISPCMNTRFVAIGAVHDELKNLYDFSTAVIKGARVRHWTSIAIMAKASIDVQVLIQ